MATSAVNMPPANEMGLNTFRVCVTEIVGQFSGVSVLTATKMG